MEQILSTDDAIQEHIEISRHLESIIPYESDGYLIESLHRDTMTEYYGLSFANQAVASIFCKEYIGVNDDKLRVKSNE